MSVYFAWDPNVYGPIKIGLTRRSVPQRIAELRTKHRKNFTWVAVDLGDIAAERALHRHFAGDRKHGEWFRRSAKLERVIWELEGCDDNPARIAAVEELTGITIKPKGGVVTAAERKRREREKAARRAAKALVTQRQKAKEHRIAQLLCAETLREARRP